MKKILLFTFAAGILSCPIFAQNDLTTPQNNGYQIPNADFEKWASDNEPGYGWNSFASAEGSLNSFAPMSPAPVKVEGRNGGSAVRLNSKNLWVANANGNLTTGTINMGDMLPADTANYNFTNLDKEGHNLLFAGQPDSVCLYAKFISGGSENGRGLFTIHDKFEYHDPARSEDEAHKVAEAAVLIPQTGEWTRFCAPFSYTELVAPLGEQYLLASITTNPVAGGSQKDTLYVDDITMIYNSKLESIAINGVALEEFNKETFSYTISFDEDMPQVDDITAVADGKGASVSSQMTDNVLTITVEGNDIAVNPENVHTYTLTFKKKIVIENNGYQIPNADFEKWASDNEPGYGWNSFASAEGSLNSFAPMSPAPVKVEGRNGGSAVRLNSKNLWVANANGNLTTGTINMGDMLPADTANYNFTNLDKEGHNLLFAGQPDSVCLYAKFISGGSENGRGLFTIHDKFEYHDPARSEDEAHKVAEAAVLIPQTGEWTRFCAPFSYTELVAPLGEQYLLASITTNPVAGGSQKDTLYVDDITMIYNSKLESIAINGVALEEFNKETFSYTISFDEDMPQVDDITAVADGKGASVSSQMTDNVLTITVEGNDIAVNPENVHTYTLTFDKASAINAVMSENITISYANGYLTIKGAAGRQAEVYTLTGQLVAQFTVGDAATQVALSHGAAYIVKVGETRQVVIAY